VKVDVINLNKPKILVLGAGYGGIMTTVNLQKMLGRDDAQITLVNKHNYHYQTTWLHENAAGTLHHDNTRIAIDEVINKSKVNFIVDTVTEIKHEDKTVVLAGGDTLTYDYLVVGLGFEPATFGIPGIKEHAFSITSINAARKIKTHIEYMFATYSSSKEKRDELLTFIVGGAGFTGIEFLGELANRVPELCKEFDVPREKVRIICVEAGPGALPGFDPELVEYAVNLLERKGVEFKIGTAIKEVQEDGVVLSKGEEMEEVKSQTIVWSAGVQGSPVCESADIGAMRGRVKVREDMRAPDHDDIFVVGDCALIINEEIDRPYPPTAQIAMQQGEAVAKNIKALINGENTSSFKPDIKGTVASLGEGEAIGLVFGRKYFGATASFLKKMIDNRYLFLLGGIGLVLKKGKLKFF
jgi:NADH:ubiquinone reductase (H+-translocating)